MSSTVRGRMGQQSVMSSWAAPDGPVGGDPPVSLAVLDTLRLEYTFRVTEHTTIQPGAVDRITLRRRPWQRASTHPSASETDINRHPASRWPATHVPDPQQRQRHHPPPRSPTTVAHHHSQAPHHMPSAKRHHHHRPTAPKRTINPLNPVTSPRNACSTTGPQNDNAACSHRPANTAIQQLLPPSHPLPPGNTNTGFRAWALLARPGPQGLRPIGISLREPRQRATDPAQRREIAELTKHAEVCTSFWCIAVWRNRTQRDANCSRRPAGSRSLSGDSQRCELDCFRRHGAGRNAGYPATRPPPTQ